MRGTIVASGLGKRFRKYRPDRAHTFEEALVRGFRRSPPEYLWGLRDVSFGVAPGRSVGVVGRNGAGKSSLLRLIGGVGRPDEGRLEVEGRLGALLDLGAGLTDDLTGRENVMIAGLVAGMSRAEVLRRFDEIVAFSELENFIDSPLRTYSSGMRMRLAFAVAVHTEPDILLVDEVLAVGDSAFQRKCLSKIAEIKASGCTIFLVSHEDALIGGLCDDVLFLKQGRVVAFGPATEVLALYRAASEARHSPAPVGDVADVRLADGRVLRQGLNRFGSREAEITAVRLLDQQVRPVNAILTGGALVVELDYALRAPLPRLRASVGINRPDGTICLDASTEIDTAAMGAVPETTRLTIERLDLAPGEYFVHVGLYEEHWSHAYDTHEQAYPLELVGPAVAKGVLAPPLAWRQVDRRREPEAARLPRTGHVS